MTTDTTTPDGQKTGIFIGSKGLRAGWGIVIFILIFVATMVAMTFGLMALHIHSKTIPGGQNGPWFVIVQEGMMTLAILVASAITLLIERRPWSAIGLSLNNSVPRFIQGLLFGVLCLAGLVGVLWACKAMTLSGIILHGADIWKFGAEYGLAFLLVGISEELLFRGYLLHALARGINFPVACVIMGALFFGAHVSNLGEGPIGLGMVFAFAVVATFAIWKTGTLWWGIGFHAAWDWMQSYFFGTPDSGLVSAGALMSAKPMGPAWLSGGTTGPEGSVLALVVMAVVVLIIQLTLRKRDYQFETKPRAVETTV